MTKKIAPRWDGNGSLPFNKEIEYQSRWVAEVDRDKWTTTTVVYLSHLHLIMLDAEGKETISGNPYDWVFRPVGGIQKSNHEEFLAGVVGVVEATSHEKFTLWKDFHDKYTWSGDGSGPGVTVGRLDDRPVCITLAVHTVNNCRILFVDATSQLVDWAMIDKWLERNLPKTAFRDNGYVNKTDAGNFGNIIS